jgi:hypothetical protein
MLHLNNANGTYSEIGQFSGISNTDWSWASLFADYDNDGWKDLFITNGYYRDYTNRDFLKYKGDYYFEKGKAKEKADTFHLVTSMTSTPVHNYMFKNNGDLTFADKSEDWGFKEKTFSNGAAYSDLDNDGDLDLVINNQNAPASVFRNLLREQNPDQNYLQLLLKGMGRNTKAIGAKITVYFGDKVQYVEEIPTRGFQSSVSYRIHIGLGNSRVADSVKIEWPEGDEITIREVKANQVLTVDQENASALKKYPVPVPPPFFTNTDPLIGYEHIEFGHNDFKRQPLLLTMLTPCGPIIKTGDVNRDGLSDIFVGGAQENPGKLFIQKDNGAFEENASMPLHSIHTDADALFFDADGDGDPDLYVASGGYNDYTEKDKALQDRLYVNDGNGRFTLSESALPQMLVSTSCVAASDFDHDGDIDLFVGGRVIPGRYPEAPESFLLENKGGKFESVSGSKASELSRIGMVTDAEWIDVNGDGWDDLVVVGEFMGIEIFLNNQGKELKLASEKFFDRPLKGLWTKMAAHDFDKDGDMDIIVGNFGLNTQMRASPERPATLVYKDFDNNGSVDPILNYYIEGETYPFASRDELLDQIYSMRSKYTSYASYADAQLKTIFTRSDLKNARVLEATTLETTYLENKEGKFIPRVLPAQAQFSPVYAIALTDFNQDGNMDVILGGNQSSIRIRMGVIDANFGQLFEGDGKGNFSYVPQPKSGLSFTGDTKAMDIVHVGNESYLLVGVNNFGILTYKLK